MGNKQNKENAPAEGSTQMIDRNPQRANQTEPKEKGAGCFGKQKSSQSKSKSKGKSCFGASKDTNPNKSGVSKTDFAKQKSFYSHETRKSTIKVNNMPNAKVDDRLFADRQNKARLDIKMKRAEPYEVLKDSDYFDSQLNDKSDLQKLRKVYDSCEIANYKTPQTQKLQTVQIKTYLFDRNLTKIEA